MKVGAKFKICKRLGGEVFEKCQTQKFQLADARSKKGGVGKRPRKLSDFGKQLLEKQKARFSYGLTEKQFRKYVTLATGTPNPTQTINAVLETRLDNVLYRAGLAVTRRQARQMVSHGHVTVDGRKRKAPSYAVSVGETIAVRDGSQNKALFTMVAASERAKAPTWLKADVSKLTVTVAAMPEYDTNSVFDFPAVFEFYSR